MKQRLIGISGLVLISFADICCSTNNSPAGEAARKNYPEAISNSRIQEFARGLYAGNDKERDTKVSAFLQANPITPVIESDSVFSLYWIGKAEQVLVNGDLQYGWAKADTMDRISLSDQAFFYISYKIPRDTRVDYTLTIDSVSGIDPRNPSVTPSGYGPHSEVAMPGFRPSPARIYRADIPHGMIDSLNFASSYPDIEARQLKIYFPPGYYTMAMLPVVYVLDGLEAMENMNYINVLDNLIADKVIEPMMVIFVPPGDRFGETIGAGSANFLKAICDEMVPLIDRNYNTDPRPERRAITGISSGGHFALYTIFSRPDVIRNAAGQSPTLTDEVINAMHAMIKSGNYHNGMKIYFDCGIYDLPGGTLNDFSFLEACRSLNNELDKNQVSHIYQEFPDGHQWANWRERTGEVLKYFFPAKP